MSLQDKAKDGILLEVQLTRKEYDYLIAACKKDKRTPEMQTKWYIESYGAGRMRYDEAGAEARALLREASREIHYPDSVAVEIVPSADKG